MERFSGDGALEIIEREKVTYIPTAPASIVAMLNSPDLKRSDLSSLRVVITGGASAAVETIKAFQAALPNAKLIELYGMLETGFHSFTRLTDDPLKVNGTVGRCVSQMGLRIIDDDGNDVPYGEVGEIAAIGPSVHFGYLNNERPIATVSPQTIGFEPAISVSSSMPKATSASPAARRRSSIAAARSTFRARSKNCCTSIQRCCRWRSSAHPMQDWVKRTACALW